MRIAISGHNIEVTPSLLEYGEEKFGLLGKLLDRFDEDGGVVLYATLERTTSHHHKGEVYRVAVDLHVPGSALHAEESHEDIHAAIDLVQEDIERQVLKYRTKHIPR